MTTSAVHSWCDAVPTLALACSLAVLPSMTSPLAAQTYRGWIGTTLHFAEVRPLGLDTVPRSDVVTDASGRLLYEGNEVTCVAGDLCTGYLPLPESRTLAATQDVSLTFWGLGMQGLSVTTLLRGRLRTGGDLVWPRSDDEFDALLAYAQLQRGPLRVRAGRQEIRSGLGMSGFDGLSGSYEGVWFRGGVYAGRSLGRGLREPANEALRGLEDFFIDHGALLFGADATLRRFGAVVTARYQREIHADRSGLVSERASLDLSGAAPWLTVSGSVDYDFSFQQIGKAHVTLSAPLSEGRWLVELLGRRYVPYFDLSTIWGFFEPVSYTEAVARAGWSPSGRWGVRLSGGWRTYEDTGTPVVLEPLTERGWRVDGAVRWQPASVWAIDGRYELEWGSGGFLSAAEVGVRRSVGDRLAVSLALMTFQQIEEFRLGDGRAFGAGAAADYDFGGRFSLAGGASFLRHRDGGNVFTSPWNQSRAWTALSVEIGGDPGLARRGRGS